jgi:rhodanese-related sulfurtransferase
VKIVAALFSFFLLAVLLFGASSEIARISQKDLQAAISRRSVVILDANGTASYNNGHIPGAIDFVAHQKDIANLLPADKNSLIVAYCANEYCPHYLIAAQAAVALGYTNVRHFAPGIAGWRKSGAPTEAQ